MTDTKGFYEGFFPVDALQYNENNQEECAAFVGGFDNSLHTGGFHREYDFGFVFANPGNWLVKKPSGMIMVFNFKPSWVENWDWCVHNLSETPCRFQTVLTEKTARMLAEELPFNGLYKRPVVRVSENDDDEWVGKWILVNK